VLDTQASAGVSSDRSEAAPHVRWLTRAVVALSALVLFSWLVIAIAHIDDTYHVSFVTGTWIALARYVNEGVLYPSLYNGHAFGGTRYMPLQFVLHAGFARLTGEYLISTKLFGYASAVALYLLAFVVYRRISKSGALAVGLVAASLSSGIGLEAATTARGDALPAAFQLAAVAVITRTSRWMTALAGALCALAFASKLSAVWGAIAILIWLALRDRTRLLMFIGSLVGCSAVLLGIFEVASSGRMTDNVLSFALTGERGGITFLGFATKVVAAAQESSTAMWILLPIAVAGVVGAGLRRVTVYHVAFVVAAVVVIVVLTDVGAYTNHFLDVQILTGAVVAGVWRMAPPAAADVVRAFVLAAVLLGTLASYITWVAYDAEAAARTLSGRTQGYETVPLAGIVQRGDRILSENPYVPVSRGVDPVVLDAFMLRRIAHDHRDWQAALIREIDARRFTKVILLKRLDPTDTWWRDFDFGRPIISAIARNYRLRDLPGYYATPDHLWVYTPDSGGSAGRLRFAVVRRRAQSDPLSIARLAPRPKSVPDVTPSLNRPT
jgi:hypothetical protein